jgi:leucyl aminopeptidase
MKISVVSGAPDERAADVLAIGVFSLPAAAAKAAEKAGGDKAETKAEAKATAKANKAARKAKPEGGGLLKGAASNVDTALDGVLGKTAEAEGFKGEAGQTFSLHTHGRIQASRVLLVGLGNPDKLQLDGLRKLAGIAVQHGNKTKAKRVVIVLPEGLDSIDTLQSIEAAAEGAHLAGYRFDRYISKEKEAPSVTDVELSVTEKVRADNALKRAAAIAEGTALARDLVNEPPSILTPVRFAEKAVEAGKAAGFKVTVMTEKEIAKENMGLLMAVAKASSPYTPPRVVKLEYTPKKARRHVAFVGKGLTFDSGGLDIKPAAGMLDMKIDMAGAAAVLGALVAIAQIEPDTKVTGYLGCVENGIGGNAYHPSDVLISRKGLSVEINNTDAEGRLVLADVIDLCITKDEPDLLIDLATLTGACVVALGPTTAGLFTEDDELAQDIRTVGKRAGEDFWRLPLNDELLGQLKSPIADMKNTGERYGGAITAALFLKQFVDGRVKWAHLDIAGPAQAEKDTEYTFKGGSGFAVRTLVGLIDAA